MICWLALAAMMVLGVSCGAKEEAPATPTPAAGDVWKPTGNEGNITGAIAFNGEAPKPRKLQMDSDPVCAQKNPSATSEEVVVSDGKLANVFVYVKSGLPSGKTFEVPTTEVTLDQNGCVYIPHVLGIQANQKLKITTNDATSHNIHPTPKENPEWNETQPPSSAPKFKSFTRPEVLIPVKCNQHSWMKAYIGVLSHPFYGVSAKDGTFTIKGLPPGDYVVEAYHEKYGAKTMNVKVAEKTDAKADFTFEAAAAYHPPSLKMQPALVLP
jgi:plastocyanin